MEHVNPGSTLNNEREIRDKVNAELEIFEVKPAERKIFKYQFILNYMCKLTTQEKIGYVLKFYLMSPNFHDTIVKELIPTLNSRKKKIKVEEKIVNEKGISPRKKTRTEKVQVERTSKFIEGEYTYLNDMLSGFHQFNQQQKHDQQLEKHIASKSNVTMKSPMSRQEALLGKSP